MKHPLIVIPIFALAATQVGAHLKAGSLLPKGGETVAIGQKVEISWFQDTGHDGLYDIYYSKNGGTSWVEFEEGWQGPKTDGVKVAYSWTVPANAATAQAKIRVCQMAGGHCTNSTYTLVSANFTISATNSVQSAVGALPSQLRFDAAAGAVEASFEMESEGRVLVEAFDVDGRLVATVYEGVRGAGPQRLSVRSTALAGSKGPFAIRLIAGSKVFSEFTEGR